MNSILVIGGGFSGLMCAYELSKHKQNVVLLEAKNRLGGRAHTINDTSFSQPIELGAEFIHGDLPHTLSLLNEAGIAYHAINDKMFRLENGKLEKQSAFTSDWDEVMKRMDSLKQDMPLIDFINTFFGDDKHEKLRASIKDFAGGFDLADVHIASTKALYREWSNEMGTQYRIDNGYKSLVDYLETQCKNNGVVIEKNCCVKKISWQENEVTVLTMCSRIFKAYKAIIATPVSVLQAYNNDENYIEFSPSILKHIEAARNIGFGSVIKVLVEFNEDFWSAKTNDAGFILTDEKLPTWWTQLPVKNKLLTGWIGGEKANSLKLKTGYEILEIALQSLANAFDISLNDIKAKLKAHRIVNWNNEPDINGGYSFNTIKSVEAKKVLREPVNDTLYFTGEVLFEGEPGGTVEAALSSAIFTTEQLVKDL